MPAAKLTRLVLPISIMLTLPGCPAGQQSGSTDDAALPAADAGLDSDLTAPDSAPAPATPSWRSRTIYLVMPDRFHNGQPANDSAGLPGCFDPGNPRAFHGGDLAGLAQRLPYLRELGVGAVWLTPLNKQAAGRAGACPYHGYWADFTAPDDGALEPRMGSATELAALRGQLAAADVRFILDLVVNHPGDTARIVAEKPTWFHDPATCAQLGDPTVYCPYRQGISDFAQEKPEVASYLDELDAGWVRRFALDGIRMDTAKHVPPAYFHDHWLPAMRAAAPGELFVVGEVFSGVRADLQRYLAAGFTSLFNFPRYYALRDTFALAGSTDLMARAVTDDLATFGLERTLDLVTFVDNHDVPRFVNGPGAGVAEAEIARRYRLALAALFAAPGIPQIYAGDELGMYGGADPDNRRDMPAWAWDSATRAGAHPREVVADAHGTFALVQRLIALRRELPALATGSYAELWRQNGAANPNVWAFFRGAGTSRALVIMNAGTSPVQIHIPIAASNMLLAADKLALTDGTRLVDRLMLGGAPATTTIAAGKLAALLPAGAVAIYTPL